MSANPGSPLPPPMVRMKLCVDGQTRSERLLEAADLSSHPSGRTRQIQDQIEAGENWEYSDREYDLRHDERSHDDG